MRADGGSAGTKHGRAGGDSEDGQGSSGQRRRETENALAVDDEEGRKPEIAEHPQRLGEEHSPNAGPSRHCEEIARACFPFLRWSRSRSDPAHACDRREGEKRDDESAEGERGPPGRLDENSAGHESDQASQEHRELLRTGRLSPSGIGEGLGDESPVGCRDRVQAHVDRKAEQREEHVRTGVPNCDRNQCKRRDEASTQDERDDTAVAPASETVTPDADPERHGESRDRVDEHDGSDQARRIADALEQYGKVGGDEDSAEPSTERGGAEGRKR